MESHCWLLPRAPTINRESYEALKKLPRDPQHEGLTDIMCFQPLFQSYFLRRCAVLPKEKLILCGIAGQKNKIGASIR